VFLFHQVPENLTAVSHLNDQEDSHDTETNRVAGEYNETVPQMPPRFTKPGNMNRMMAKPAGNMLRLKCPAEGKKYSVQNYIPAVIAEAVRSWLVTAEPWV
jgi:hypothetical protein